MRARSVALSLAILGGGLGAVQAETQVGVSVSVNQPGLYGRVDIGNAPPPPLIFAQPVVIRPAPVPQRAPVYLRVPPGHEKNWAKHCHEYNACAQPVYFVKAEGRSHGGRHGDEGHGNKHGGKGEGRGHGNKHD